MAVRSEGEEGGADTERQSRYCMFGFPRILCGPDDVSKALPAAYPLLCSCSPVSEVFLHGVIHVEINSKTEELNAYDNCK